MDTFYLLPIKYLTKRNLYLAFTYCLIYYQLYKHKYSYAKDGYTHVHACACVIYMNRVCTHLAYISHILNKNIQNLYEIYIFSEKCPT